MSELDLKGSRILVVEDEYMLADELASELAAAGAEVLGPVGTVREALDLLERQHHIGAAALDINLHGEMAYAVADAFIARSIPFVFTTGYDTAVVPARFADIVRCEKPAVASEIARAIGGRIEARRRVAH